MVNCGKYMCTILYYMSLSLYRIAHTKELRAFFIFCATINAVYCSMMTKGRHISDEATVARYLGRGDGLESA